MLRDFQETHTLVTKFVLQSQLLEGLGDNMGRAEIGGLFLLCGIKA